MITISKIKEYLESHPRMNYIVYSFRFILPSKDKCRYIISLAEDPNVIEVHHNGNTSTPKILYEISIAPSWKMSGFCFLLRVTLLHMY